MPTQLEIGTHLDMSERNAGEVVKRLGIDYRAASMDEIRVAYIRDLREKAAGRGGEAQGDYMAAKTAEARASAELKLLQIKEKAGELVPINAIEPRLAAMVTAARVELLSLPDKVAAEMKTLYGIDVDQSLIEERIYDALAHLASSLHDDGPDDDGADREDVGTAA